MVENVQLRKLKIKLSFTFFFDQSIFPLDFSNFESWIFISTQIYPVPEEVVPAHLIEFSIKYKQFSVHSLCILNLVNLRSYQKACDIHKQVSRQCMQFFLACRIIFFDQSEVECVEKHFRITKYVLKGFLFTDIVTGVSHHLYLFLQTTTIKFS